MLRILTLTLVLRASLARAIPTTGDTLPTVTVEGTDGKPRALPDKKIATVVIYEDQNAGKQNMRAGTLIDKTTSRTENNGKLEAVAVADLGKWNWWPAKKFALAEVKKISAKERYMIWMDWTANVRKTWRLTKGKSGILVLGTDGRVRFAGEGPLSDEQIHALAQAMTELGAKVPDPASVSPELKHVAPVIPDEHKVPEPK
jgi:hypothetical protein